jgi:hypothetical protein
MAAVCTLCGVHDYMTAHQQNQIDLCGVPTLTMKIIELIPVRVSSSDCDAARDIKCGVYLTKYIALVR